MIRFSAAILLLGANVSSAPALGPQGAEADIRLSVVRVSVTRHYPDLRRPWSRLSPDELVGTGLVIDDNRILTNAHLVSHAAQIVVQSVNSADRHRATVATSAPGIDLAVLDVVDGPITDRPAVQFASDLPKIGDPVVAYGYPIGGQGLSVTEGVISRFEYADYYYGFLGLRVQIDAALNPGNSGGPVMSNGKVIGLVFSGIREAENIGYMIPSEEILAFLHDIEDGSYEGRSQLLDRTQTLDNPALRAKLGLDDDTTGVMVVEPSDADAGYPLKPWDVITAIGDYDIDNAGMVEVGELRLGFGYLVARLSVEGRTSLSVHRSGQLLTVDVPTRSRPNKLVAYLAGDLPSYFIYGPFVFTPLYTELAERLDAKYLVEIASAIATRRSAKTSEIEHELVVVPSPLLPHAIGQGYEIRYPVVLSRVNGETVGSLRDLVGKLRNLRDEYVIFEWADLATETMVFRRDEIIEATEEILDRNGIRAQCSSDLRDLWFDAAP